MLGKLGDIAGLLKSAKDLQGNVAKLQSELDKRRYVGDAGGGVVRATVDGRCSLVDIKIDPKATADVELLEDLIRAAVGSATSQAQEAMKAEMSGLVGGLNMPGLTALLGGGQ